MKWLILISICSIIICCGGAKRRKPDITPNNFFSGSKSYSPHSVNVYRQGGLILGFPPPPIYPNWPTGNYFYKPGGPNVTN
jgi:hypothetical protein